MLAMPAPHQRGRPAWAPFFVFGLALALSSCRADKERAAPHGDPQPATEPAKGEDLDSLEGLDMDAMLPPPLLDWPVHDVHITSFFEWRADPLGAGARMHKGIDLRGAVGDPVLSVGPGRVSTSSYDSVLGHHVVVDHADGLQSLYAHLDGRTVFAGVPVSRGTQLGTLGNTGRSEAPHLHLTIRVDGIAVDPLTVLRAPAHGADLMAQPLYEAPQPSPTDTDD